MFGKKKKPEEVFEETEDIEDDDNDEEDEKPTVMPIKKQQTKFATLIAAEVLNDGTVRHVFVSNYSMGIVGQKFEA